ncbi:hypothetical protein H696_03415 [Fonticula alba]|uniref:Diphosphomevalonate decarboxylase n=1 Tax=Fonticula alba TaxID=691883 RepID=A0A058Z6R7_FONAL|nr:hypothetical protein H696_03415 [Fonticula alba]KCV69950.1 hypothetical protein H696_03415 [Fonticula alba]|eukprot:XP_009495556.1 hypothetical protein H696_03415 [Fonticula alba]
MSESASVTCTAPVNIAIIKYWGKRDVERNLPTNGSISVTLSQKALRTTTSVHLSPEHPADRLWLNGKEDANASRAGTRLAKVFDLIRRLARQEGNPRAEWHAHVASHNSFPTAAGLASSASGFACLAFSLAKAYGLQAGNDVLSGIARQGSGSACRSLFGGYVAWEHGYEEAASPEDEDFGSHAVQLADEGHWPEMAIFVHIVSAEKKTVSSTSGMQTTVRTSPLHTYRAAHVVPARMEAMRQAIAARDFDAFAKLTMEDSNQFHATCLDTYPPIFYLNDTSRDLIQLVHRFNEQQGAIMAAYTYDAGPNAVVYIKREACRAWLDAVAALYRPANGLRANGDAWFSDAHDEVLPAWAAADYAPANPAATAELVAPFQAAPGAVDGLLFSLPGGGPEVIADPEASLLDAAGMPKTLAN